MFGAFYPGQSYPGQGPGSLFQAAWALDEWLIGLGTRMLINTAGQRIGQQMVTAADGSAFTGAVTISVTIDAGVQATGTVGAGACNHEGLGYFTYAPSQAETNGSLIAYTFTGTGAIPRTVQVYTIAGDPFTRLGAPAGASVSADVLAIKTETATILADTNDIQTRLPAALVAGRIDASVGAMATGVITALAIAADAITDAKVAADVTIASVTGAVGSVTGNVGGSVASVGAGGITATSLAADTLTAAKVAADVGVEIATAVWAELAANHVVSGSFGQRLGVVRAGAAQAGAATTITLDAGASAVDSFYNGTMVFITAGTGVGQARRITGYVGATKVATVPAWVTAPAISSAFVLLPENAMPELADIQARLPAALVTGRMDSSVGAMAAGVLTATAIAADAITDAKVAADVTIASVTGAVGSVTGAVGSVTGAVGSVTAGVTVTTNNDKTGYAVGVGGIGATAFAASAITAAALAADAVDEIFDEQIADGTITMRQALRVLIAGMAGKISGAATTTVTIRNTADTANVVVATVDADGNRSAVTITP